MTYIIDAAKLRLPIIYILLMTSLFCHSNTIDDNNIVVIPIKKEIGSTTWNYTKNGLELADSTDAKAVIIHMNTYGGQVTFADSIRSAILNYSKPVHVFIDNNAASAGALIAIACDSIYMREGGTMGAATVVNQTGEKAPDKYQSYMRATIRATAEAQGRDPKIAEAMVDQDLFIMGISDTGKLLTLTVNEAIKLNYCESKAEDIAEVISKLGFTDYDIINYEPSTYDNIKGFLMNPIFHGILIMLIIGGIYFELQSPGIGFPLIISILASILYFAPLYIDGLASNWEIALFIVGIILIALEIFVIPGFGIAGISGGTLAFVGLLLSMVNNINFNFENVETDALVIATLTSTIALLGGSVLAIWLTSKFWDKGPLSKLALSSSQDIDKGYISVDIDTSLIGKKAICVTSLHPSGKVMIENEIYDAAALYGIINKGEEVIIKKQETSQLYVLKANTDI